MPSSSSRVFSVYSLKCSVCDEQFFDKQKWMDHLALDDHQKLARNVNISMQLDNRDFKECCLVIFTSYDITVTVAKKIIEYFGTRNQSSMVTDFVWWVDRPRIGITQFESRNKVDEVLAGISSYDLLFIDNQLVQVKRAIDLLDLEYNALLPGNNVKPQSTSEALSVRRKRDKKSESEDCLPSSKKYCGTSSAPHHPPPNLPPPPSIPENSSFQSQYLSIRKLVVIPDNLLSQATKAVSSLKALFNVNDPSAEVTVFRTWYLNLSRSTVSSSNYEDLVVYLYRTISPLQFRSSYSMFARELVCQLLFDIEKGHNDQKEFTILDKDPAQYTWRLRYTDTSTCTSIPILLISHKFTMAEVQICRLYKYMMTFDPRFEHLLSLLYFWTSVNGVTIGENESDLKRKNLFLSLPEPLTMQWLLIHFMCYRKYIPTVREIQERPHQVLRERLRGIDIGFNEDPDFVEEWKMSREIGEGGTGMENVLQLFADFFQFCWFTLDGNNCIFNTKDGEVISTNSFLTSDPGTPGDFLWTTKMTTEELKLLRGLHMGSGDKKILNTTYKVNLQKWKLYMVHPFIFTCRFSICRDMALVLVLRLMKSCEEKLRAFLNTTKTEGIKIAEKRFGKLENILTVDVREKKKM